MLIPVRCFTCGKVIGNKWGKLVELLKNNVQLGYFEYKFYTK